jgi:dihydropteroate synthase
VKKDRGSLTVVFHVPLRGQGGLVPPAVADLKSSLGLRPMAVAEAGREAARCVLAILSDDDELQARVAQLGARAGLKVTAGAITPLHPAGIGAGAPFVTGSLVSGPRGGFEKIFEVLGASGVATERALALRGDAALEEAPASRDLVCGPFTLKPATLAGGGRPLVMGVLNATPDSFSDGGRYGSVEAAVARGIEMAEQGADLLDVGGESTRPGSEGVDAETEAGRAVPVVAALAARVKIPISIDTTKAEVAHRAVEAGATLINDISGMTIDARMPAFAAGAGLPVILNHIRGVPRTMQESPSFDHVVLEVLLELAVRVRAAREAGVAASKIVVDPGAGFGKRPGDNFALIRHLGVFRALGAPVLIGVSRKSFLGAATGRPVSDRRSATLAAEVIAAASGAEILRTHEPAETIDALKVARALAGSP